MNIPLGCSASFCLTNSGQQEYFSKLKMNKVYLPLPCNADLLSLCHLMVPKRNLKAFVIINPHHYLTNYVFFHGPIFPCLFKMKVTNVDKNITEIFFKGTNFGIGDGFQDGFQPLIIRKASAIASIPSDPTIYSATTI